MDLGNSVVTVMNRLLIGGMVCLGHWDEFPMMSILVYVTHIKQDLR